jgi:membrane protease YdiL (CAAX protease family)
MHAWRGREVRSFIASLVYPRHNGVVAAQTNIVIWRDAHLGAAFVAAPAFWAGLWWWNSPPLDLLWILREPLGFAIPALIYPILEEIVFRGGLQTVLLRYSRGSKRWGGFTVANIITSAVFSALHLLSHAPLWSAAAFLPSVVFGYFRDRHSSLISPMALHVFYNAGYFWLFGLH